MKQDKILSLVVAAGMAIFLSSCVGSGNRPLLSAPPRPGITLDYNKQMLSVTHHHPE